MKERGPGCQPGEHGHGKTPRPEVSQAALDRAASLFRAMGDGPRLRILQLLQHGEACVTEIVERLEEKFSTISQRLRILRGEGLISRRRENTHLFYALADRHVVDLLQNALAHAMELEAPPRNEWKDDEPRRKKMANTHPNHDHQHGPDCGHKAVKHDGHVDYLHDGHLHHQNGGTVEEHVLPVTGANPAGCTPKHDCGGHGKSHVHGPACGHDAVPHGDHVDYLVDGHLHHPHGDHCDDHGPIKLG